MTISTAEGEISNSSASISGRAEMAPCPCSIFPVKQATRPSAPIRRKALKSDGRLRPPPWKRAGSWPTSHSASPTPTMTTILQALHKRLDSLVQFAVTGGKLGGGLDGLNDPRMGPAAADVILHAVLDLLQRRLRFFLQQGHGGQDHARRAIPALHGVVLGEGPLDGVERLAPGQPLDRPHGFAPHGFQGKLAGLDGLVVEEHRAGPAIALAAAEFRPGQAEIGAQRPEQRLPAVGFDGLAHATQRLNVHECGRGLAGPEVIKLVSPANGLDLVELAAEPNHHVAGDIGVPRHAGQHPLQHRQRLAQIGHTTSLVREGNHPVHIGEVALELLMPKAVPHVTGHRSGTVHAGNDRQVVARAHPAPGAGVALEITHLFRRVVTNGPGIRAELIVAPEIL